MTWHKFRQVLALDQDGQLVTAGVGQVFAPDDTTLSTPLVVRDWSGAGFPGGAVPAANGVVARFEVEDHMTVLWVSGAHQVDVWSPAAHEAAAAASASAADASRVAAEAAQAAAEAAESATAAISEDEDNLLREVEDGIILTPEDLPAFGAEGTVTSVNNVEPVDGNVTLNAAAVGARASDWVPDVAGVDGLTAALAAKANTVSPTFTGTVTGVSKAHVGLGNVDNTSDANKPVSTAQGTAIVGVAARSTTTITSASNTNINVAQAITSPHHTVAIAVSAFAGTATVSLLVGGALAGHVRHLILTMAPGAGTVEIRNLTSDGVLLGTVPANNSGAPVIYHVDSVFGGTDWSTASVVPASLPAILAAAIVVTGEPGTGNLVAFDGTDYVPAPVADATSVDIPHGEGSNVSAELVALWAEVEALKTTGPIISNLVLPSITGTPVVGETLTAVDGEWSPEPDSVDYQWLREGEPIESETSSTYELVEDDIGATTISVRVTAVKDGYTNKSATSLAVTVEAEPLALELPSSAVTAFENSATTITVAKPSGVVTGDVLLVALYSATSAGASNWSAQGGSGTWVPAGPDWPGSSSAARVVGFFAHVVTNAASEPSSYVFERNSAATRNVGVMWIARNAPLTGFVNVAVSDYYGTNITGGKRTASLNVTKDACLQFFLGADSFTAGNSHVPTTVPSGFTLLAQAVTSGSVGATSRSAISVYYREVDAGATGTSDIAWSAAQNPVAQSIVLEPAA